MPRYEYHCQDCNEHQNHDCSYQDRPKTIDCKKCGGKAEYRPALTHIAYYKKSRHSNDVIDWRIAS